MRPSPCPSQPSRPAPSRSPVRIKRRNPAACCADLSPAPKPGHATVAATPRTRQPGAKISLWIDVSRSRASTSMRRAPASSTSRSPLKLDAAAADQGGQAGRTRSRRSMIFADEKVPVFAKPFRLTQEVDARFTSLKPGATRRRRRHGGLPGVRRQGLFPARVGAGQLDGDGEVDAALQGCHGSRQP